MEFCQRHQDITGRAANRIKPGLTALMFGHVSLHMRQKTTTTKQQKKKQNKAKTLKASLVNHPNAQSQYNIIATIIAKVFIKKNKTKDNTKITRGKNTNEISRLIYLNVKYCQKAGKL